ncbi:hypothetical protein EL17_09555 [Anditalea andensis]|uniref:Uncharacterized protein n=1 Tax=Anditalea andensis TaxID=1048983 RepID=A0A074LIX7_9BACT|nr:hypothetical protein EL17_09555 [Anditalea andensis]
MDTQVTLTQPVPNCIKNFITYRLAEKIFDTVFGITWVDSSTFQAHRFREIFPRNYIYFIPYLRVV